MEEQFPAPSAPAIPIDLLASLRPELMPSEKEKSNESGRFSFGKEEDDPPSARTRKAIRESLRMIGESVKKGLGLNPGVTMMEIDVSAWNPFAKEKWGIDTESTRIWVPQTSDAKPGESFFGPPLADIFGESNVRVYGGVAKESAVPLQRKDPLSSACDPLTSSSSTMPPGL